MTPTRRLIPVANPAGTPTAAALAKYLRWLAGHRGRSGRITSPETVRAYTCALPIAFAGIANLAELDGPSRDRLRNVHTARLLGRLLAARLTAAAQAAPAAGVRCD